VVGKVKGKDGELGVRRGGLVTYILQASS
jgi:hypothetical protein